MNTPVSFDIKMLLIEKGITLHHTVKYADDHKTIKEFTIHDKPTIADVIMWLYEKHGIWIYVNIATDFGYNETWAWNTINPDNKDINGFNSPTEAYEAAILYTLNNLI